MAYKTTRGKRPEPVDPPCNKTIYHSAEEAMDVVRHITETRVVRALRPYRCSVCGFWHLTSRQD
jgi:hypothetical protein